MLTHDVALWWQLSKEQQAARGSEKSLRMENAMRQENLAQRKMEAGLA